MQKKLARFLLFIFLVQTTQLTEVGKATLLVQHYVQHVHLFPGTTLVSFLKMHYLDKTVIDDDYAQDMQLPFKTIDSHCFTIQFPMPPPAIVPKAALLLMAEKTIPEYCTDSTIQFTSIIFQPPKQS